MENAEREAASAKYIGVFTSLSKKFCAKIRILGKKTRYYLGSYITAEEAAHAADLGLLASRGREGTKTNFPSDEYTDEAIADLRVRLREPGKRIRATRYRGVSAQGPQAWRSRLVTQNQEVRLGTFKDEQQAAFCYDLGQLYVHGCDVSACMAKLNFPQKWSQYSTTQLQAETREVGNCITAGLLKNADPAAVVQQEARRRQPLPSITLQAGAGAAAGQHSAAAGCVELKQGVSAADQHTSAAAAGGGARGEAAAAPDGGRAQLLEAASKSKRRRAAAAAGISQQAVQLADQPRQAPASTSDSVTGAATAVGPGRAVTVGLAGKGKQAVGVKQPGGKTGEQQSSSISLASAAWDQAAAAKLVQNGGPFAAAAAVAAVTAVTAAREKLTHVRGEREAARYLSPQQLKAARKVVKAAKAELKDAKAAAAAAAGAAQPAKVASATKHAAAAAVQAAKYQQPKPHASQQQQQQQSKKRLREDSVTAAGAKTDGGEVSKDDRGVLTSQQLKQQEAKVNTLRASAGQQQQQQCLPSCSKPNSKGTCLQQGLDVPQKASTLRPPSSSSLGSSKRKWQVDEVDLQQLPAAGKKQKLHSKPNSAPCATAPHHHTLGRELSAPAVPAAAGAPAHGCRQPAGISQPAAASTCIAATKGYKKGGRGTAAAAAAAATANPGRAADWGERPVPEQHQQHQRVLLQRVANLQGLLFGGRAQLTSAAKPLRGLQHNGVKKRRKGSKAEKFL